MELKPGYRQTEVGVIPEDWRVLRLEELIRVKSGYAFSSAYFVDRGPVLLTPGNFKLGGGLYFNERNTKHYSGGYVPAMVLNRGDLLVVMTDLTPDCNLLGKPAFILHDELILHNQRIGKVVPVGDISLGFLYYFFLSQAHAARMKETATGSTVRHTSTRSIYNSNVGVPSNRAEQETIAEALSDADALVESLEQLLTKKRQLKQGAMQELLTGKKRLPGFSGEWEVRLLGDVTDTDPENLGSDTRADFLFNYISLEDVDQGALRGSTEQVFVTSPSRARRKIRKGDVLVSTVRPNLMSHLLFLLDKDDWVCSTGFCVVRCRQGITHPGYVYAHMFADTINRQIESLLTGSNYPAINRGDVAALQIPLPSYSEQTAIATILSDMDADISALEAKLSKARAIKQGMMQQLLTGAIRLIEREPLSAERGV